MLHCRVLAQVGYNARALRQSGRSRPRALQDPAPLMLSFDNPLVRYGLLLVGGLFLLALLYFIYVGVRALFREARQIARQAGHSEGAATVRAAVRMAVWSLFFLAFYFAAFLLGRRLGWWGVPAGAVALVVMVGGLLVTEKLLTVKPGDTRGDVVVGATVAGILALFAVVIWVIA